MKALLGVLPWVKPYKRFALAALCGTVIEVIINLLIPLQTARVIDDGILKGDTGLVRNTVITMVALILGGMLVGGITRAMAVRLAFNTVTDLRRDLYGHAQSFSFGNLDHLSSGEVLTRLTSDITKLTLILTMGLSFMAQVPLMFTGALLAIVVLDASLAIVVLFLVPAGGAVVWYVLSRSGLLYDAVQTRLDRLNTVLQENIQGIEVIKAFVREDHQTNRFNAVADDLAGQATMVNQLIASMMPTLILITSFGTASVIWLGGNNVIDGNLSEGNLVAFISYLVMVAVPMIMFSFIQPMLSAAGASMARITQVFNEQPEVVDLRDDDGASGIDLGAQAKPGDIRFEGVSFRYGAHNPDSNGGEQMDEALTSIDLHIPQGTTAAILGATGSGKTTLVHLIPRFYDVTEGVVKVGGIDVRALTQSSLRKNVGIALQQPELFSGTVMENLKFGQPNATHEEVIAAAKDAQAHEFVSAMPDGYESAIEQGGANLSGGQRQRLAIARTLLVNPAILILDDSTSAVDLETEARIQAALEAYEQQTVVLVAQRISTALGADMIVVLEKGCVCAVGSHEELLASSDVYQEIYRSQLGEPAV